MSCCVRAAVLGVPRGIAILSSRRPCRFHWGIMLFRADAATRRFISQDRELCAGAMLRLAGCSSGRRDCARGGSVLRGVRFCWNVLRSVYAGHTFLLECFALDHACCLPHSAKQDGLRDVAFLFRRGSRSPFVRSRVAVRLSDLAGSLRDCTFSGGDPDGERRRRRERGDDEGTRERSRRRCVSAFLRKHIGFAMFSAGSTLGLRAPDCAKESSTLWTLFRGWPSEKVRFTRRGCVGTDSRRRHSGTRVDPPGSDKWKRHCPP